MCVPSVREKTSELKRQHREVVANVSNRKPTQLPSKVNCQFRITHTIWKLKDSKETFHAATFLVTSKLCLFGKLRTEWFTHILPKTQMIKKREKKAKESFSRM